MISDIKVGDVIYGDDVSLADKETDEASIKKKQYILIHKSLQSDSKEGDAYSSPSRNSEGYISLEEYQKEKELELRRQPAYKAQSQIVFKDNSETCLLKKMSQTQLRINTRTEK
ncbi:unnamed protein product [Paramecium sonneborni]|uniref:Uncharacterized protein n=1 Tax=Paramecium sonneborni TaxID=65129 RepID=A0A8S1PKW2_9CILI|nr:unnamed protein product [Paramecium sonneborni]